MATEKEEIAVKSEEMDVDNGKEEGDLGVKEKTIRKALPKAVLRRRNNSRIKKMAMPKAPLQVLNELVGPSNVTCNIVPSDVLYNGIRPVTAQIVAGGDTFSGCGPNKNVAKNIAAEAAVHKIAMSRFQEKADSDNNEWKFQETVPWGALASMALFKLLNDWQANGYAIPPQLCSQEFDMKGLGGESGMGAGSVMGAGGAMSGMGAGGVMSGMGGPQRMGSNLDFTDESGAFHAFAAAQRMPRMGPGMPMNVSGMQRMGMGPGMSMKGSGMLGMGSGMQGMGSRMQGMGSGMPGMSSGMPGMGPGSINSTEKHPVSLLMEKHGKDCVTFEGSEEGEVGSKVFISVCQVNGTSFTGKAKSKKEAKKLAAIEALASG